MGTQDVFQQKSVFRPLRSLMLEVVLLPWLQHYTNIFTNSETADTINEAYAENL